MWRFLASRGVELLLGASGLAYFILGDGSQEEQVRFLLLWNPVAFLYLLFGALAVRRQRHADPAVPSPLPKPGVLARRISFLLTVAATVTGLNAALGVLADTNDDQYAPLIRGLGVAAMMFAWMLLHSGYARFYSFWPQWRFPSCPNPGPVDFLYFSFTVGVSFAASDVEVHDRALRWHVMVHSVLSFFYNAIVLATAVGIITGD